MSRSEKTHHTAIHEAGHAVAHVRLDIMQGAVSVLAQNGSLGRVSAEGVDHVEGRKEAENQAIAYCAGYAALVAAGIDEAIALRGTDDDLENVAVLIRQWLVGTSLDQWKSAAIEMMRMPRNIAAVNLLALELERRNHIDGDEIDVMVGFSDGDISAEQLVRYRALRAASEARP
jgi:hypothetical protein